METQVEPFICPFCYTTPSLPPFSSDSTPNFTWCPLISVGLLFANRSIKPMSALGRRRLCTSQFPDYFIRPLTLTLVARRISTSFTDPDALQPLQASVLREEDNQVNARY